MFATKRLGKELQKARQKLPPGITLVKAEDFREWQLDIQVLDNNPLYAGQTFRLSFIFSNNYPIEAPEVSFLRITPPATQSTSNLSSSLTSNSASNPIDLTRENTAESPTNAIVRPIPIHPHIYSNGIICLDLLGTAGWSPVQSVESVCMSIQSMLTGNTKRERPQGDEDFCRSMGVRGPNGWSGGGARGWSGGRGLKDVRFVYDDNTV